MRVARHSLLSRRPAIGFSDFTMLHGNVVVIGVGFWDILHGQAGVAPNGIELHSVLSFHGHLYAMGSALNYQDIRSRVIGPLVRPAH